MLSRSKRERGAVAVLVAVLLFPIVLFFAFAVDVGNWWVHKRHLQTQADAGALAAGLGPWLPVCNDDGNDPDSIVSKAREYAGNLGLGYNPQYTNAANVHVLLNSSSYWNDGGADFSEDGKTPCQTLFDPATDPATGKPKPGYVDVKATEANLPNLFGTIPGFSVVPAINRRARIEIQKQTLGTGIRPIAVRDDTAFQCAQIVRYRAGAPSTPLQTITLARTTGPPTTNYTEFQNTGGASVTMPGTGDAGNQLYVRVRLFGTRDAGGNCTGAYEEYPTDDNGNPVGGANFINVYSAAGPTATPAVHSVTVTNGGCAPDQYFSFSTGGASCSVTVVADVEFRAQDLTRSPRVEINGVNASGGPRVWTRTFSISPRSGPLAFSIRPRYNGCNNNTCPDQGIRQQTYSGLNDDGEPSSSGPISMLQIGEGAPGVGANSFERSTTHNLVFTVRVVGLANSLPTDPPIVLRYRVQQSKRTGLVDCGQGNGASADEEAILNGCPRPLYVWPPGTNCVIWQNTPDGAPINCVGLTPGNRTNKIPGAIRQRVGNSCNNWNAYRDSNGATTFPPGDPRMMTFIITSPTALSGGGGSNVDIPVLLFATFYVTGADRMTGNGTDCQNEPYPGPGNRDQAAIWGHWIKWADSGGGGSGEGCVPNEFGACVAVLTR